MYKFSLLHADIIRLALLGVFSLGILGSVNITANGKETNKNSDKKKPELVSESLTAIEARNKKLLLEDSNVAPIYKQCKETHAGDNAKIGNCLFVELKKNYGPEGTAQILESYVSDIRNESSEEATNNNDEKNDNNNKKNKNGSNLGVQFLGNNTTTSHNPGMVAFEDYLYKQLREALYGEIVAEVNESDPNAKETTTANDNKPKKIVDHVVFYQLFEGQLTKNVLTTISSYCIDAGPSTYLISKNEVDREKQREKNINGLSEFSPEKKDENIASASWTNCFKSLLPICEGRKTKGINDYSTQDMQNNEDYKYSKEKACLITAQLKRLRQALITIVPIREEFDKIQKESSDKNESVASINAGSAGYEIYQQGKGDDEKSIDELTTITSGDIKRGFAKAQGEASKEFDENCINGKNNEEICKKYFANEEQKKEIESRAMVEIVKAKSMGDKVEAIDSEEKVKEFLKTEGRTDKEIERILAASDGENAEQKLEAIKKSIQNQFKQEKEELVNQLAKRINATDKTEGNKTAIAKELKSRAKEYAQLLHYNNIVSGYLKVTETNPTKPEEKKETLNTALMFRELEDNAYVASGRDVASGEGGKAEPIEGSTAENIKQLKEKIEEAGIKKPAKVENPVNITVDQINEQMLLYDVPKSGENTTDSN